MSLDDRRANGPDASGLVNCSRVPENLRNEHENAEHCTDDERGGDGKGHHRASDVEPDAVHNEEHDDGEDHLCEQALLVAERAGCHGNWELLQQSDQYLFVIRER